MGSISRSNVHDVLKNKPRDRVVVVAGEKRIVRRPEGRDVRQFVDPQGNVVWLQLLKFGTTQGIEQIDLERGRRMRQGFVEFNKCPVLHGTVMHERLSEEFSDMPRELQRKCSEDPVIHEIRGRHTYVNDPCPHIQWLISSRREREAEACALRATKIETTVSLEKQRLEVQQKQLDATNALIAQLAGRPAAAVVSEAAPQPLGDPFRDRTEDLEHELAPPGPIEPDLEPELEPEPEPAKPSRRKKPE